MIGSSRDAALLSRREFLRRSGMAAVAVAGTAGLNAVRTRTASGAASDAIPALDVAQPVRAVAAMADGLFAVGGHVGEGINAPAVWTFRFGEGAWEQSAAADAFPPGTALVAAAAFNGMKLAAGHVTELSRVETLHDGRTGEPIAISIFASQPAIFLSSDGGTWQHVLAAVPGIEMGAFTAMTATDGASALAVGSQHLEAGVGEGYGLIAMTSVDGHVWESIEFDGVDQPRHGSVSLLAQAGSETLLGSNSVDGTKLFRTSGGPWEDIPVPLPDVSYIAAAATDSTYLLAGIDETATARTWLRSGEAWEEIRGLAGVPPGTMVIDLEVVNGGFVALGSSDGTRIVAEIGV